MSRWDEGLGVNSEDPDDIEIGCGVYSKTHTHTSSFPRGGVVVGLTLDADESVLSVITMEHGIGGRLDTFEIDRADVDMATVTWYGRNARVAAEIVNRWLSSRRAPKDQHVKLRWQRTALDLAEAAASGQWLPKAEARFRRVQAAKAAS